jgi:hypothetical protein
MNYRKLLKAILFGSLATVITVSCTQNKNAQFASTDNREHADDAILTSKIKSVLIGDSSLKNDIVIKTYAGIVQLSGFVTQAEADRAVFLARRVKGVKAVNDTLIVKPSYEIPTTGITKESSTVAVPNTEPVAKNLEEIKSKCKELGFKPQSEKFGKCILELTK